MSSEILSGDSINVMPKPSFLSVTRGGGGISQFMIKEGLEGGWGWEAAVCEGGVKTYFARLSPAQGE